MKRLVVSGQKGGVGKTTTAVNVAHGLALAGRSVCIVDCDAQGHAAMFLDVDRESCMLDWLIGKVPFERVVRPARENLWIVPGDRRTAVAESVLTKQGSDLSYLASLVKKARLPDGKRPDWWVFDTGPGVGFLQEAAMYASDWMLAVCAMDQASMDGLVQVLDTMIRVNSDRAGNEAGTPADSGGCGLLYIVPTMFDNQTIESRLIMEELANLQWGKHVLTPPISHCVIFRECISEARTIYEMPVRRSQEVRARDDYVRLVREVMEYG